MRKWCANYFLQLCFLSFLAKKNHFINIEIWQFFCKHRKNIHTIVFFSVLLKSRENYWMFFWSVQWILLKWNDIFSMKKMKWKWFMKDLVKIEQKLFILYLKVLLYFESVCIILLDEIVNKIDKRAIKRLKFSRKRFQKFNSSSDRHKQFFVVLNTYSTYYI